MSGTYTWELRRELDEARVVQRGNGGRDPGAHDAGAEQHQPLPLVLWGGVIGRRLDGESADQSTTLITL